MAVRKIRADGDPAYDNGAGPNDGGSSGRAQITQRAGGADALRGSNRAAGRDCAAVGGGRRAHPHSHRSPRDAGRAKAHSLDAGHHRCRRSESAYSRACRTDGDDRGRLRPLSGCFGGGEREHHAGPRPGAGPRTGFKCTVGFGR